MDYLAVFYNPSDDSASVVVSSSAPVSGMDGPGGVHSPDESFRRKTKPGVKGGDLMKIIKSVIVNDDYSFKRYGKPTKNFNWPGVGHGLSVALCSAALGKQRAANDPEAKADTQQATYKSNPTALGWDAASPDERAHMFRQEMDLVDSDVEKLSNMNWAEVIDKFDLDTLNDFKYFARSHFGRA
jgi:hypothetical protein